MAAFLAVIQTEKDHLIASRNGGELSHSSFCNHAAVGFCSNLLQARQCHSLLAYGRSAASRLPCAGAAPANAPPSSLPTVLILPPQMSCRGRPCACPGPLQEPEHNNTPPPPPIPQLTPFPPTWIAPTIFLSLDTVPLNHIMYPVPTLFICIRQTPKEARP